jgi:hypothetical protein
MNNNRETRRFLCPVCGKNKLEVTHAPHRDGGGMTVLVHCWCGAGQKELAAASGIKPYRLLCWPPPEELGRPVGQFRGTRVKAGPPSAAAVAGWHSRLMSTPEALRYLTEERGLTLETVETYELGYSGDRRAIVIPIRDAAGQLHSAKFRSLDPDAPNGKKKRGLARPAALYPVRVLTGQAWPDFVVLCEGEFDALLSNQNGIPAVTSTSGTGGWQTHPEWAQLFAGWEVAVIYDAGSEPQAAMRAAALCQAGAEAWAVALHLGEGEDISDWFVMHQRTAAELRQLIHRSQSRLTR